MSSSPKDTAEATEPLKSSDVDTQPWNDDKRRKFETKSKSEFYDPCQEAAQRSYRCLFRNGGDKNMCGEYFQAYRDCKQAWVRYINTMLQLKRIPKTYHSRRPTNGKRKAAAGSNGLIRSQQPALTCYIQPGSAS
ncbi:cytochrome c oxidase-assembly factor COX23, mitochondrial [Fusarium oxysporum f. sp. pisi HDV247]|uniref:Cytochrome c oxidase-assembly factor COX23, mitochondrial n=1 Tax=Fusarium oxysporum f. sp. pisi HDV247 TaxID=1080344 RepID=W9PUM9_FUSOX|nr:cytochrome c oxidase-assembly factor COX23, mitochondrial [Fusarium oxysporum f. sp. pisi HDV247]